MNLFELEAKLYEEVSYTKPRTTPQADTVDYEVIANTEMSSWMR